MTRLSVKKTYKLYIGGAFPRSQTWAGRSRPAATTSRGRPARTPAMRCGQREPRFPAWSGMTAYNRGQVLYRLAEMMETRASDLEGACSGRAEVEAAIDRTVWYAGWADKLAQVLGSSNPVAGPYFDFTVPEPTGVVATLAPSEPPLLGLVSRTLPALVANAVVAVAGEPAAVAAVELAEALATSDFPGGAVNVLTGFADELAPWLAGHMDVNAIDLTGIDGSTAELERSAAENVKRVIRSGADSQSLWEIAAFLELKTVWHPIGLSATLSRASRRRPGGSCDPTRSFARTQTTRGRPRA